MKKLFTLFILFLLLPVTALAAAPSGQVIYVGNFEVTNGGYWTTDNNGNVTAFTGEGTPADSYIRYDAENNILTLHNATIKVSVPLETSTSYLAGAAIGVLNQSGDAELTITLEGTNTIANVNSGINMLAASESTTSSSSLTITGDGSLNASASQRGIMVQSNSSDAALKIENAKVTATIVDSYGGNGVLVQSKEDSSASLTVNGGSLTATGKDANDAGIYLRFGSAVSGSGTPTVTVSGNAIVRANGGIGDNSTADITIGADSSSNNGGIVWNGKDGTVYGNVTLQGNITIGEGESLTIPDGSSLNMGGHEITVESGGKLEGEPGGDGTVVSAPKITTESLPDGTVNQPYSATLEATGNNITWSLANETTLPDGLTLNSDGTITGTPTTAGSSTFTVKAENSAGSTSKDCTLNIKSATVPVTGVTLNTTLLSLYTGGSETLTATIEPSDATNQNVTWSSNNEAVATVDANGKVTAVAAGETDITVTTEDGPFTATCKVTVKQHTHSLTKTDYKAPTCTEDGNIEYWYCDGCSKYFSDEAGTTEISLDETVIYATGHHYVNGTCTECGHRDPDYRPDPISYYNIYVEDVCDGVEVSTSKNVVREGGTISLYVEKDTANYTFDNFKVYYKRTYYGTWETLEEGVQPGEYPIHNIWTHIYVKVIGAEEKEDPTGIESVEGVKVYTKDGSLYVQTPQREQVIIVSMSGAVVKSEEQIGLKQYHGLQPGIYIVRIGDRAYKLRLN